MSLNHFKPQSPSTTIGNNTGDNALANLSQLNVIVDYINNGGLEDVITAGNGTVGAPSFTFASDLDTGFYRVSANTIGLALGGVEIAQFNPTQLSWLIGNISAIGNLYGTDLVASKLSMVTPGASAPVNVTGALTAARLHLGRITSTSAAPTTITLPTTASLFAELSAAAGSVFEFTVDNTSGASVVTMATGTGMTIAKQTSNGDSAVDQLLTVQADATKGAGIFKILFLSGTASILFRVC